MAERYTKLFSLPENLYAEGAPVLIAAGALLRDNANGTVLAQLKLKNITEKTIRAATVKISPFDTAGRPLGEAVQHDYLDLNITRDGEFGQKSLVALPDKSVRSYTVSVIEAVFADGSIWTAIERAWESLEKQQSLREILGNQDLAEQYAIESGSTNDLSPTEYKDLWYCSCGAVNRSEEESCHTCHNNKSALLAALNKDTLQIALDKRKAEETAEAERKRIEEEEKAAAQRAAAEAQAKKTKKILAIVLPIVAVCIAALIVVTMVIIPNKHYNIAIELMEDGEYEDAINAFEALGEYKDSSKQIESCETAILDIAYNDAVALMEAGDYKAAIDDFEAIEGYKDSAEQITECDYLFAVQLVDTGKYKEAIEAFEVLDDYKDSVSKSIDAYKLYKTELLYTASVGDIVLFGTYEQDNNTANGTEDIEWRVLEKEGDKILVISEYALDCQQYNTSYESYEDITWEDCTLRDWLNDEFLKSAFSRDEQAMIPEVTVSANEKPLYSTETGNDTRDRVFLLSTSEAEEYFASDEDRKGIPTDYAIEQGAHGYLNCFGANCCWWLRSPGSYLCYTAEVDNDGSIDYHGNSANYLYGCIRPAMWIRLDEE